VPRRGSDRAASPPGRGLVVVELRLLRAARRLADAVGVDRLLPTGGHQRSSPAPSPCSPWPWWRGTTSAAAAARCDPATSTAAHPSCWRRHDRPACPAQVLRRYGGGELCHAPVGARGRVSPSLPSGLLTRPVWPVPATAR